MKKRIKRILSFTMALLLTLQIPAMAVETNTDSAPTKATTEQNYYANTGELQEAAFIQLPMGAVEAESWLLQQLYLQKYGLTGYIHDNVAIYNENNAWRGGYGDNWEKGPYYMRGLVSLAWTLDDAELKEMAMEWIDGVLGTQQESGFFGPTNNLDWWPRMVVIQVLRDYYEATELEGNPDERVLPFLEKYFEYQLENLPTRPVNADYWAQFRGGDNIEVVLWYYNRVYDAQNPTESDWLIELAEELYKTTTKWTDVFTDTTVREHVVNTTQGMKTPAVIYQLTGSEEDRDAMWQGLFNMGIDHGRVDGLANADEAARDNYPYRGTETCAVVEDILSTGMTMRILGEGWLGDNLEHLAYNSLPACYSADFTSHCYFQAQNQVMLTHGSHEFGNDYGDSCAFGAPAAYECCFPNMHMGWPKFIQNMYMATTDNGLAVIAYGPNNVEALVADGKTARFQQETNYPFNGDITLTYSGDTAEFPLMLRVPEWCKNPTFQVNGETVTGEIVDGFLTIDRTWTADDVVTINFPMELRFSSWYNNSVVVDRGPLTFTLEIEEDWRIIENHNDTRDPMNYYQQIGEEYPYRETYPASAWNYALVLEDGFEVEVADEIPLQPFTPQNSPITIKATGQLLPDWQLLGNVVPEPPYSPVAEDEAQQTEVTLIPYGCSKLRITQIPWVGDTTSLDTVRTADTAKTYEDDGVSVTEFDNVVVRNANDYDMTVYYSGSGSMTMNLNEKYETTLSFPEGGGSITVNDLQSLISDYYFRFDYGQFNNIRFYGDDVTIEKIVITPTGVVTEPEIVSAKPNSDATGVTLTTNLTREDAFYEVEYGTESGVYTNTATGFRTGTADITGLTPGETCYFRVNVRLNGELCSTNEVSVTLESTVKEQVTFKDDFSDPEASAANWTIYGDESVVSFSDGKMHVGSSNNIKIVANTEKAADYAVIAEVSGPENPSNNFGIMFRCPTVTGDNGDSYQGYYAGVGFNTGAWSNGLAVGKSNNAWQYVGGNDEVAYEAGKTYELKVLVQDDTYIVFVDGVERYRFSDSDYAEGWGGVRSYEQSFDVDSFEIRALTAEEQALFGGTEGEGSSVANFSDDFSNVETSTAQWSLLGDQSKMHINEGSLSFDASDNVKAVAGDNTWTDYVVESEITLGDGGSNAGLMFRVVDAQENGTDSYRGYYCGIGTGGVTIGYGNNGWKQLDFISRSITANEPHTLKVVVCADKIAIYLDDEFITSFRDTRYAAGMIGFRGFNQAFSVSNVTVRPYDEATDGDAFEGIGEYQISDTCSSWEAIQFKFEAVGGADDYKIVYGTESGVYTGAVYELVVPWSTQYVKAGISGLENGQTYYLRLIAMQGDRELLTSGEVVVTAGERLDISDQLAELDTQLKAGEQISTEGCSAESVERLNWAIENAYNTLSNPNADMIDVSLADRSLRIGEGELAEATEEEPEVQTYTITVTQAEGGVIAPAAAIVNEGEDKTFTITANEGYVVKEVLVDGASVGAVSSYTFEDVTANHSITAVFAEDGSEQPEAETYTVTFNTNGGSSIEAVKVEKGATVAKPADPTKDGYTFAGWYTDAELTTAYDFNADVTGDFTLYAKWTENPSSGGSTGGGSTGGSTDTDIDDENTPLGDLIFHDVKSTDWFAEAVQYVAKNGLMSGTSKEEFSPNGDMTRAMFVTVLARMEGIDTSTGDTWYEVGREWAMENGISDGTNMESSITREQIATMLYRYAGSPAVSGTITGFTDTADVSDWAEDAMVWAVQNGIITGIGDTLKPQGNATRAQVATMLMRLIESED